MIFVIVTVLLLHLYLFSEVNCHGGENAPIDVNTDVQHITDFEAVIVLSVCGFIIVVVLLVDVVYYLAAMKMYDRYNTPNKNLLKLLDRKENVIDVHSLQPQISAVISMRPLQTVEKALKKFDNSRIKIFLDGIALASTGCKTETLPGARDNGTLPIATENRLKLAGRSTNLHISKLSDLYDNPIYLAASPLPNQFVDQWEAIWQENIGVIVWAGRLSSDGKHRMDSYIDLREGYEVNHGDFCIKTVESGDLKYKFAIYYLRVRRKRKTRELVLVHAYEWLQETVSWALRRDVELVMCLKDEHLRRIKDAGLRGVLFQCKLGTAGSCSLFAVYLGFQFWVRGRKVNLYGILQYIRRMRAMAFEKTGDPQHEFFTQVKVAYAVFYGVAKFCDTAKIPLFEQWLMDILRKSSPRPPDEPAPGAQSELLSLKSAH